MPPAHDTIQQVLREDLESARALLRTALERQPREPALLRLQAESEARSGRYAAAWEAYRAAAAAEGVLLRPIPDSVCGVCACEDAALCWVGTVDAAVQAWLRCDECRTARRAVAPSSQAAATARRAELAAEEMTLERLQGALHRADSLIERIRDEGYGLRWLDRPNGSGRASMLVLGSGWGDLLANAEWRGFEVQGVESDSAAAAWAQASLGVVVWGCLDAVPPDPKDVIVVSSGLGETAQAGALLDALGRRLVPDGLLVVRVPCLDHPIHRARGYDDPRWSAPAAASWFDRPGISLALLRAGFQPLRSWHHPKSPGDIYVLARKE